MKAKEFDERIDNEDFFDVVDKYEEVKLNEIFKNKTLYLFIKEKAEKLGITPEKMAEILLAERLGLI
jgi:hypothetical protein